MRASCSPGVGSQQPSAMPQLAGQGLPSQGLSCHQQRGRGGWGPRGQWPGPFRRLMPSRPWHVELHVGRLEAFHSKLVRPTPVRKGTPPTQPWGRRRDRVTSRPAFLILTPQVWCHKPALLNTRCGLWWYSLRKPGLRKACLGQNGKMSQQSS